MLTFSRFRPLALALAMTAGFSVPSAADDGVIALDLNRVDQVEAACRLTFTIRNGTGADLESLVYEIVLFEAEGGVAAMTLFDFGQVPQDRLRARQFDVAGAGCADLAGILVNGVAACGVAGAPSDTCLAATRLGSRSGVEVLQ